MNGPVRIGVLGCSAIARRRTLPVMRDADHIEVAAVASRSADKAREYAAGFGGEPCGYHELLARPDVDAVYIGLPNALHHEWARLALLAGKHVLCEKPLATDQSSAKDLEDLATTNRLVLRENFAFLNHPQHDEVKRLVADGRLGAVRTVAAAFGFPPLPATDIRYRAELGGGALLDAGVYPIRLAWHLLGDGLSVAGAVLRVDPALGVDVSGHALLTSPDGVFADLEFGFQHTYRSRYQIWGSAAALRLDHAFTPPPGHRGSLDIEEQDHGEQLVMPAAHQFRLSVERFADAVRTGWSARTEAPWLAGARETARLAEEIRAVAVTVPAQAGAA
ncbi:Gfo/Idh/MocA family protein [Actinophytocola algeriensis]|uniref:Putative dehydrogenase n=1 Tax=Actinophytocola algeriensis TaxID=1768010 RepID=A0A7W7QDE2_9PSEU|nr:Gfo/Idh/MocA family oxidoreductase [Actinophytocola algeriensis]MBB4911557.1 putative dehydrogenase [Actinophytocola algeriensis]MBE1473455.1 putative dehydrogenase [Actinophytocola algeriensis]